MRRKIMAIMVASMMALTMVGCKKAADVPAEAPTTETVVEAETAQTEDQSETTETTEVKEEEEVTADADAKVEEVAQDTDTEAEVTQEEVSGDEEPEEANTETAKEETVEAKAETATETKVEDKTETQTQTETADNTQNVTENTQNTTTEDTTQNNTDTTEVSQNNDTGFDESYVRYTNGELSVGDTFIDPVYGECIVGESGGFRPIAEYNAEIERQAREAAEEAARAERLAYYKEHPDECPHENAVTGEDGFSGRPGWFCPDCGTIIYLDE